MAITLKSLVGSTITFKSLSSDHGITDVNGDTLCVKLNGNDNINTTSYVYENADSIRLFTIPNYPERVYYALEFGCSNGFVTVFGHYVDSSNITDQTAFIMQNELSDEFTTLTFEDNITVAWYTPIDDNTTYFMQGDNVQNSLTTKWFDATTVSESTGGGESATETTIIYDANGGTFLDGGQSTTDTTITETTSLSENDNGSVLEFSQDDITDRLLSAQHKPVRTWYTFLGWSASNTATSVDSTVKVTITNNTIHFYAVWLRTTSSTNLKNYIQNLVNIVGVKTGKTGTINAQDLGSEIANIETGITPTGTIEIKQNGEYDVTNYGNANVEVKGQPYEAQGEEFERLLASGTLKLNDVVLNLDEEKYYKVVSDESGNFVYEEISGEIVELWDGTYEESGEYKGMNAEVSAQQINVSDTSNVTVVDDNTIRLEG